MAAKKGEYYNYTNGNLAHNLNAYPSEERRKRPSYEPQRRSRQKEVKEMGISLGSLMVLSIAIVVTLYVCTNYLKQYASVKTMEDKVFVLEQQLKEKVDKNNYNLELINSKLDYEHIYNMAVAELGMVYPNNNKVINYQQVEKDVVKQFRDIPKTENQILEDIIKSYVSKND